MRNLFNKIGNVFVKPLLRSPLHSLVSRYLMLVTFTGRKSGKVYSTPVQYKREGDIITFCTRKDRVWWKNLQGGAAITVRVKGQDITAVPEVVVDDEAAVTGGIKLMYPFMSPEQVAKLKPSAVIIRLHVRQVELATAAG